MQLKKLFGNRLRALRAEMQFTQERLADAVGVTIESISNIERGIYAPSFDTLEKLATALNVEVQEMFNFDDLD